jgi:hypothetical protein
MLPSETAFEQAASALGIQNDDWLVVYDTKGLFSAARVWWYPSLPLPRVLMSSILQLFSLRQWFNPCLVRQRMESQRFWFIDGVEMLLGSGIVWIELSLPTVEYA